MAPLRFSANLSWLFPELPDLPARLRAAGSSGFEAAEVAWPYAEQPEALARAARAAGLQLVLINTPPGDQEKREMGLGAVPGRQAAFREGLEQAVLYAKALGCPRIHLMAGRVPQGADRAAIRGEMETVFLENLRHAAGVLAQRQPSYRRLEDPTSNCKWPQQEPGPKSFHICPQGMCRWHRSLAEGSQGVLESYISPTCSSYWKMKDTKALWAASIGLKETQ